MQISNIQNGQNSVVYGARTAAEISGSEYEKSDGSGVKVHNRDEYIPGEEDEPIGLYSLSQDDEGNPKIDYDSPEKSDKKSEDSPEKSDKSRSESCTGNTDTADREIERLKKKAEQLEQRINTAEGKERERLERQLKNVQNELAQKDNDNYRRQHAVFS